MKLSTAVLIFAWVCFGLINVGPSGAKEAVEARLRQASGVTDVCSPESPEDWYRRRFARSHDRQFLEMDSFLKNSGLATRGYDDRNFRQLRSLALRNRYTRPSLACWASKGDILAAWQLGDMGVREGTIQSIDELLRVMSPALEGSQDTILLATLNFWVECNRLLRQGSVRCPNGLPEAQWTVALFLASSLSGRDEAEYWSMRAYSNGYGPARALPEVFEACSAYNKVLSACEFYAELVKRRP